MNQGDEIPGWKLAEDFFRANEKIGLTAIGVSANAYDLTVGCLWRRIPDSCVSEAVNDPINVV